MITIHIPNMECGGCAKGVSATLAEAAPGAAVEIALDRREVRVAAPDPAPILAALRADGWQAEVAA